MICFRNCNFNKAPDQTMASRKFRRSWRMSTHSKWWLSRNSARVCQRCAFGKLEISCEMFSRPEFYPLRKGHHERKQHYCSWPKVIPNDSIFHCKFSLALWCSKHKFQARMTKTVTVIIPILALKFLRTYLQYLTEMMIQ